MASVTRIDATISGAAEPPLAAWLAMLAPQGALNLTASGDRVPGLKTALIFSGFVDVTATASAGGATVLTAAKPAWELGAAGKLPKLSARVVRTVSKAGVQGAGLSNTPTVKFLPRVLFRLDRILRVVLRLALCARPPVSIHIYA